MYSSEILFYSLGCEFGVASWRGYLNISLLTNRFVLASSIAALAVIAAITQCAQTASAEGLTALDVQQTRASTIPEIAENASRIVTPPPNVLPTDMSPLGPRWNPNALLGESTKFRMLQALPSRAFFNCTTEVSQRLDTNCLFTYNQPQANYALRVFPNVTLGYNVLRNTGVYANYFMIKDVFSRFGNVLNQPTVQSAAIGVRHTVNLGERTNAVFDFQSRELWQAAGLQQADLIPSVSLVHALSPRTVLFSGVVLQMRGKNFCQGPSRELDPFYTVGAVHRRGQWNFVASNTLVTNYRNQTAIPNTSNASMIADFEISRPLVPQLPSTRVFVRAEPVWNWASRNVAGLSGFDFRLYGGLRLTADKPAYTASIDKLRRQIHELNESTEQVANIDESEDM